MSFPRVLEPAPDFTGTALLPNCQIGEISLSDYSGQCLVIFFYPYDFTRSSRLQLQFIARSKLAIEHFRGSAVIAISCDSVNGHFRWCIMPKRKGGLGFLGFPLVGDFHGTIARAYGVYNNTVGVSRWGIFIITGDGILRHMGITDNIPTVDYAQDMIRVLQIILRSCMSEEIIDHPTVWKDMIPVPGSPLSADSDDSDFSRYCLMPQVVHMNDTNVKSKKKQRVNDTSPHKLVEFGRKKLVNKINKKLSLQTCIPSTNELHMQLEKCEPSPSPLLVKKKQFLEPTFYKKCHKVENLENSTDTSAQKYAEREKKEGSVAENEENTPSLHIVELEPNEEKDNIEEPRHVYSRMVESFSKLNMFQSPDESIQSDSTDHSNGVSDTSHAFDSIKHSKSE